MSQSLQIGEETPNKKSELQSGFEPLSPAWKDILVQKLNPEFSEFLEMSLLIILITFQKLSFV